MRATRGWGERTSVCFGALSFEDAKSSFHSFRLRRAQSGRSTAAAEIVSPPSHPETVTVCTSGRGREAGKPARD